MVKYKLTRRPKLTKELPDGWDVIGEYVPSAAIRRAVLNGARQPHLESDVLWWAATEMYNQGRP